MTIVHFDDHRIFLDGFKQMMKIALPEINIKGFTQGNCAPDCLKMKQDNINLLP